MIELDQCIFYWKAYADQHEYQMTDQQLNTMLSTIKHLAEYRKLKEQVNVKMSLKPSDDTG